ncbi:TPR-like protein [Ceratobasidium sp. AG-I]|nr:TPR-like protein [Ceratobasidium sp. AG-I]
MLLPEGSATIVHPGNQSRSLLNQFHTSGEPQHLDSAIHHGEKAITLTPEGHPFRSDVLNVLALSYMCRFKHQGKPEDIKKATLYSIQSVNSSPEHLVGSRFLTLGMVYTYRFSAFKIREDIDHALFSMAQAMDRTSPDLVHPSSILNEIGFSLQSRFKDLNDTLDIDCAIVYHTQSLVGTRRHREYPMWLMNLGVALRERFRYLDRKEDIDSSVLHLRRAVRITPDIQVNLKAICINNLASALDTRFDHLGELADLDECILVMNETVLDGPSGYPENARSLDNLGYYLEKRFEHLGNLADINLAILYQKEAISLAPINGAPPSWHNNLGNSHSSRFQHLNDPKDLNEAIRHMEKVVKITLPSDVLRSMSLNNLSTFLLQRFEGEGDLEDIDASIDYLNEALLSPNINHAHKARWLGNLGLSYTTRYMRLGGINDLDDSIKYRNLACSLIPEGHIYRCETLSGLGRSYIYRFSHLNRPIDLILGIRAFNEAAFLSSGKPYHKFTAALSCARASIQLDKPFALKLYKLAMGLLPSVVWLGTTVQRRYEDISGIGSAVTEAVGAAIESQDCELALEWLEQGRSIVWQQILNLRTPFDELSRVNPVLASRLQEVARQLEYGGHSQATSSGLLRNAPISEKEGQKQRRLAEEWDRKLEEVRRIAGFESFLRPRKAAELFGTAQIGAVVVINVSESRCDALALRPNSQTVTHIPLPNFSYQKSATAYKQLIHSLQRKGMRERGIQVGQTQRGDTFESLLSLLWLDVVQPVLESLGYMVAPSNDLPHITWCTTGPLSFLPLHATGDYSKLNARVYNYAISSYTPTLSALVVSNRSSHMFNGILTVGQINTPGFETLPGTAHELNRIKQQAMHVRHTQLDGQDAIISAVLDAIETHSWVHFACHASQDTPDPTASAFHLHDGPLSLKNIMKKSYKNAGLAFLSACQTAKGDADLPDEAVHLAAGMLMAGYPSVVATMWSIQDEDAPLVAEEVYARLLEGEKPDSRRAAKALHIAVERLREKVGEKAFTSWVPYMHLGI